MLIRSQDRNKIYKFDTIFEIWIDNDGCGGPVRVNIKGNDGSTDIIGEYKYFTKGRKVLDMIQEAYMCSLYSDSAFDDAAKVQRPYIFAANKVFQVPKDEELEA